MKKLIVLTLAAAVGVLCSLNVVAADKPDKKTEKAEKKEIRPPFNGKISAVDKTARTIKVGERTFSITPTTKIMMAGKPATLEDVKVGEEVGGQYREGDGGKLEVLSLRVGPKPEKKPKNDESK